MKKFNLLLAGGLTGWVYISLPYILVTLFGWGVAFVVYTVIGLVGAVVFEDEIISQ